MDLISGLILGTTYVAAPGPIVVETLRQGVRGGLRASLAVQLGSVIGLLLYASLALGGAALFLQESAWQAAAGVGGMLALVYLGIATIRDGRALLPQADGPRESSLRQALGAGAVLSLANPLDIAFWLSLGTGALHDRAPGSGAFFGAFVVGCLAAALMVALFAAFWRSRLDSRTVRALSWACGLLLIAFGLKLGLATTAEAALVNYKISGPAPPFGGIDNAELSPDGKTVLFTAWHEGDAAENLYSAPLDGSSDPIKLNGPVGNGGYVGPFSVSPDSTRAVFKVYQQTFGPYELYSAPMDGSAPPVKLNAPLPLGAYGVFTFAISADGGSVVFVADQDTDDDFELYSVPLDGSSGPLKLNGPMVSFGDVEEFLISPDSSRVVFRADHLVDGRFELGSVPIDGSALPVRLNGPLIADGDVQPDFQISPDSSRVVFRADYQTDEMFELGSVPIDRSEPPIRLSRSLVSDGDVENFLISPNSSQVVFSGDFETIGMEELGSVPIDGSSAPVKLNGPLVNGGDVSSDFRISPDSSRVVYIADAEEDSRYELFVTAIGGGGSPARLNAALVEDGLVYRFTMSSDGTWIVYQADQESDDVVELFAVPLDLSAPPVKLNGPLVSGGDVFRVFNLSPDGKWVVYIADQETDEVDELYRVTTDGSSAALKMSGQLVEGGSVSPLAELPAAYISQDADGLRVLYKADQEIEGISELFVTYELPPSLNFAAASSSTPESAGTTTVTVQLSEAASMEVQVDYFVSGGTASGGGVDFTLDDGTLIFRPGEVTQQLQIVTVDDAEVETDETVIVSLVNPQEAVLGSPATFTLTIEDDDVLEQVSYKSYAPFFTR